jgi:hypothetical protein
VAEQVGKGGFKKGWPDVIPVPTAGSKTSVLDMGIFELAMQAELQPSRRRTAARRVWPQAKFWY